MSGAVYTTIQTSQCSFSYKTTPEMVDLCTKLKLKQYSSHKQTYT